MKRSIHLIAAIVVLGSCVLISCRKGRDYFENNPNAEVKICPIVKISYSPFPGNEDTITFTYNAQGNPVSGMRRVPRTGGPNYIFKYDKKNRLSEFVGIYSGGYSAEFWHKYFYDASGKIIRDSNYIFVRVVNGQPVDPALTPEPDMSSLTFYTYDSKDRITRDSTVFPNNYIRIQRYSYDLNGNRIGAGLLYDEKINFRRTNSIWMFLDRDYSVNNPFVAEAYNSIGLPTNINLPVKVSLPSFIENYFSQAKIDYLCNY